MSTGKTILKNTSILIIAQLLQRLFSLLLIVCIARKLGDSDLGSYSFGLAFGGLLVVLADFGINVFLVREVAGNRELANRFFCASFIAKLFLSMIAIAALCVLAVQMRSLPEERYLIIALGVMLCVRSLAATPQAVFRAYERMEYEGAINTADRLLTSIAGILVILQGGSILTVAAALLCVAIINLFTSLLYVKKFIREFNWKLDRKLLQHILVSAAPFGLVALFGTLCFKIDTIMLSYYWGDAQVGWYNAAFKIVFALMFIPAAFTDSLFPFVSRLYSGPDEKFKTAYYGALRVITQLSVPAAIATTVFAPHIIRMLYGPNFSHSITALQILVWVGVLLAITSLQSIVIAAAKQAGKTAFVSGLNALSNVILNFLFIPRHGHEGACYASLFTLVISFCLLSYYSHLIVGSIGFIQMLFKILCASGGMVAVLICARTLPLFLSLLLSFTAYVALSTLLGSFTKNDFSLIKKMIG